MAKLVTTKNPGGWNEYHFYCPGCKHSHAFTDSWGFNGDMEKPTVQHSIGVHYPDANIMDCHSFIRDGKIEYCGDSKHALASQTVDMIDIEEPC